GRSCQNGGSAWYKLAAVLNCFIWRVAPSAKEFVRLDLPSRRNQSAAGMAMLPRQARLSGIKRTSSDVAKPCLLNYPKVWHPYSEVCHQLFRSIGSSAHNIIANPDPCRYTIVPGGCAVRGTLIGSPRSAALEMDAGHEMRDFAGKTLISVIDDDE